MLKNKDPRKTALLNKATGSMVAEKSGKNLPKKSTIDELVSETINTKGVASGKTASQKAGAALTADQTQCQTFAED